MKLSDSIQRTPLFVAFGQTQQTGGLTSVDLEAVRDESTVTLTASDGSVAPIDGADASTAGVMTAADKVTLDGLSSAGVRAFAARSEVPAASIDAAITQIRTAGHAGAGDGGGALYVRAGSEPGHALKVQSADGAWWELVAENGWINVLQAGADPTGAADSIQAFRDCADFARHNTGDEQSAGANGPAIYVPHGKYHWSDTFEPRAGITMIGFKRGVDGNLGTIIEVAADKTGIILPKHDTAGDTGVEEPNDTTTKGANGSFIEGLKLTSLGGTNHDRHGIRIRVAGVMLSHVECRNFPGDGFHIVADWNGNNHPVGVANSWSMDRCTAINNQRNGVFIQGSDVNAGVSTALNLVRNGRWGIWDNSFLSNVHIGAHAQGNGGANAAENGTEGVSAYVAHNNERYMVVPGQEAAASTTTPGTDSSVWYPFDTGGATISFPAWVSGNTYTAGGSYFMEGNGQKQAIGCYSEGDNVAAVEGNSQLQGGTNANPPLSLVSGGSYGSFTEGNRFTKGGVKVSPTLDTQNAAYAVEILNPEDPHALIRMKVPSEPSFGLGFRWDDSRKTLKAFATIASNSECFEVLTNDSTYNFGRGNGFEPGRGNILFQQGIFVGDRDFAGRFLNFGHSPPGSDRHAKGEVVLNASPEVQTDTDGVEWIIHGWHCTSSGTPGTWRALWTRVSNPPGL